jgi:hypothetical protein
MPEREAQTSTGSDSERPQIDWVKTLAGALAAVSSAVLLSTLGAAGTIIGAALGSVVVTVASNLYSQALARSRDRMAAAQAAALQRVGIAQAEVRRAARRRMSETAVEGHLAHADDQLIEAQVSLESSVPPSGWRSLLRELPWKRIALAAGAVFLVAVVVITAFELITGRAVSSYTGGTRSHSGTTLSHVTGNSGSTAKRTPSHAVTSATPSSTPTTASTPTASPSSSPTPPSSASPTPTEAPLESPTGSPSQGGLLSPVSSPTG